jgi:TolB protein
MPFLALLAAAVLLLGAAAPAVGAPGDLLVVNTGVEDYGEVDNVSYRPAISADGRFLAYASFAFGTGNPLYLHDLQRGVTTLVASPPTEEWDAGYESETPVLSADGRYLAFASDDPDLSDEDRDRVKTATGSAVVQDVFVYDRRTKKVTLVSRRSGRRGTPAEWPSSRPSISDDGRTVAYVTSSWNLAPPGPPVPGGIFARDLRTEANRMVSGEPGIQWWHPGSFFPDISGDGRRVAFGFQYSPTPYNPKNPPKNESRWARERNKQIMLAAPRWKEPRLVSRADGRRGRPSNRDCVEASASTTGRFIAFTCEGTNLVRGDRNGFTDVFVRDVKLNRTTLVSSPKGKGAIGNEDSEHASISGDGRFVVFHSLADNLVPGDRDKGRSRRGKFDVFVKDLRTGALRLLSRGLGGEPSDGNSANPVITPDGRFVAFASTSANLSPEDTRHDLSIYRLRLRP